MSLFQCEVCGCVENTACAAQGFVMMRRLFDWSYAPEREGKLLCSVCGPVRHSDGTPTEFGEWHGRFSRTFLPLGQFVTNDRGNLAHRETGDEDYHAYAVQQQEQPHE